MSEKEKTRYKPVWFDPHTEELWKQDKTADKTFSKYVKRLVMRDIEIRRLISKSG